MNENKLRELVLFLVSVVLIVFLVKYLKLLEYLVLLFHVLIPVFIGFIYAWLVNPFIRKFSKKYHRNLVCVCFFFLFLFVVGLFLYLLIPTVYREIGELLEILPSMFGNMEKQINHLGFKDFLDKIFSFLVENIPIYLLSIVKNTFRYLGVICIGLVLGLYMSFDYEKIVKKLFMLVPKKYECLVVQLLLEVSEEVRKCVNGTLLVAFCVFVMDSIGFFLVGLEAPLLFGVLCGLTDLIPYVGPYIGGAAAVLVGFTESKFVGIITIVICFFVQSIENYILQPIVMSKSIKISPVFIIIGLLVFGKIFGIVGMIIATPSVAMIKVILEHIPIVKEKCKE